MNHDKLYHDAAFKDPVGNFGSGRFYYHAAAPVDVVRRQYAPDQPVYWDIRIGDRIVGTIEHQPDLEDKAHDDCCCICGESTGTSGWHGKPAHRTCVDKFVADLNRIYDANPVPGL